MKTAYGATLIALTAFGAIAPWTPLSRDLEAKTLDLRFQLRGPLASRPPVVVVAIDQPTFEAWDIPKAAWPEKFSALLAKLDALGVKRIGLDFVIETDIDNYLSDKGSNETPMFNLAQVLERLGHRAVLGTQTGNDVVDQLAVVPGVALASVSIEEASGRTVRALPRYDTNLAPPIQGLASRLVEPATPRTDPIEINYAGRPIPTVSAIDVLEGKIEKDLFLGAYVLVGSTYETSLDNQHSTPFTDWTSGVMINAEAADTVLSNRELRYPASWVPSAVSAFLSLVFTVFAWRVFPAWYFAVTILVAASGCWAAFVAFTRFFQVWPIFVPLLLMLVIVPGTVYALRAIEEHREASRTRQQWGVFMPEEFVQRVEANRKKGLGAWEKVEACILFMDIVDFTELTNKRGGRAVLDSVNAVFGITIEEIQSAGGIILNFMGDGLSAMFEMKSPEEASRVRRKALDCCWRIFDRLRVLNDSIAKSSGPLAIRIGLSSGNTNLALVGSEDRRQMTVYGSAVNLAARCEQAGKDLNPGGEPKISSPLVVTEEFTPLLDSSGRRFRPVNYQPKGWSEPLKLFYWEPSLSGPSPT